MGSERVAMMCGGICVRLDAHLPRKLALFLIWYKTPRGGKTAEISKILTFLHGRPHRVNRHNRSDLHVNVFLSQGGLLTVFEQGEGKHLWA